MKTNRLTNFYYLILNDSPNIILAIDPDYKIVFFNKTAEKIFGIKREEVLGKDFQQFFQKLGLLERSRLVDSLKYRKVFEIENIPLKIGEHQKHFWGKSYPVIDQTGELLGAVLVGWDTHGKQVVGQEHINHEKFAVIKTIAAGTAHEIRNPLTTVKGFIQLLGQEKLQDQESKVFLDTIVQEINRIEKIIADLLVLSHDSGLKKGIVNLNRLVERASESIAPAAYLNNISIIKNLNYGLPLILGDDERLFFVLTNLLTNACEAIGKDGLITLETFFDEKEGKVGLRISDNGPGVPEELQSKIFEPFFTTKTEGTGLGLAICYRTVEEHNGSIKVYNNASGGATFEITLPLNLENAYS
ncbi:two-component system sensor histidine kinase NtrB [Carboxydothermus pertinax]|uniref:histidine kinase n=1 Tax=Carboxydothermus pertinax TaxID=870242 RepID=A0A1L8CVP3_9THEO|nr:ATP-binding protein [Carboxydothermus pertinax]GAV23025.1 PAS domain-containing sensor histidine kinase [Carboxydothermus pertinax]